MKKYFFSFIIFIVSILNFNCKENINNSTTYTISTTISGNGNIIPNGNVNVKENANQKFTFTANNGYYVDSIIIDENYIADSLSSYTFYNVTSNHIIKVVFAQMPSQISYSNHIQKIFNRSCATSGCHNSISNSANLNLSSWENVMNGSNLGAVVIPFRSDKSLVVNLFEGISLRKNHPQIEKPIHSYEIEFLKMWINDGTKNDNGEIPFTNSIHKVYVPNQNDDEVAVIDIDKMLITRFIKVGNKSILESPHFIVAKGNYWYVSLINSGEIWKFDSRNDSLIGTVEIDGSPALLALTPDGNKLYVSQFMIGDIKKIFVVNTNTMTVTNQITVGNMPHGIRMNNAGTKLYVANMMSDNISVIDVANDDVIATIPLAYDVPPIGTSNYQPMEIAVSPNDELIAVTCSKKNEVRTFQTSDYTLKDSFSVGNEPWHLQFSQNGDYIYVTNRLGNSLSAIHTQMIGHIQTVTNPSLFDYPHGCDVSENYIFVSNENTSHNFIPKYNLEFIGNLLVINKSTLQIEKHIEVGKMPTGISVLK